MSSPLSLATLLKEITKELCFESTTGIPLQTIWEYLSTKVETLDEFTKKLIFANLKNNKNVEFLQRAEEISNNKKKSKSAEDPIIPLEERKSLTIEDEDKFLLRAELDYQFFQLTNETRSKTSVGGAPYELLLEIAKSREQGIDSLTLTTVTKQDQRSLTTRINSLNHLVVKLQILKKGRSLSLFIFKPFATQEVLNGIIEVKTKEDGTLNENFNLNGFRQKLMSILEKSKGGIRQFRDLRRELESDKTARLRKMYRSSITFLDEKGYLDRVFVTLAQSNKKTRAVRFIKPFVDQNAHNEGSGAEEEESDEDEEAGEEDEEEEEEEEEEEVPEFNETLIDDELKMLEGGGGGNSTTNTEGNATGVSELNETNSSKMKISLVKDTHFKIPTFHRFEPSQCQLFQLIDGFKMKGSTSANALNSIFGSGYARVFYKLTECYIHEKHPKHLTNQQIVRFYDSKGRLRFYRYFTRPNFNRLVGAANEPIDEFSGVKRSTKTIHNLDRSEFVSISSMVDIYEEDGVHKVYWHGSSGVPPSVKKTMLKSSADYSYPKRDSDIPDDPDFPRRKRGRPRKGEERPKSDTKKAKTTKNNAGAKGQTEAPLLPPPPTPPPPPSTGVITETANEPASSEPVTVTEPVAHPEGAMENQSGNGPIETKINVDLMAPAIPSSTKISKPHIVFEDLSGNSFQTIERYQSIIQVLVDSQGVKLNDLAFLHEIRAQLGYNADKKTLIKDLHSLIQQGKIHKQVIEVCQEETQKTELHQVIVLSGTTQQTIDDFTSSLLVPKTKKPPRDLQVLNDVNIEYFDESFDYDKVQQKKAEAAAIAAARAAEESSKAKAAKADKIKKRRAAIAAIKNSSKKKIAKAVSRERKLPSKLLKSLKKGVTNLETGNTKRSRKPRPAESRKLSRRRTTKTLTPQESLTLFKAVIICKTINKSDILWDKVAELIVDKDPSYLRSVWPRVRTMMGPTGVVKATRTLKKLILRNIRAGHITDEEVLNLDDNLGKLVEMWNDSESSTTVDLNEIENYENDDEGINDQLNSYLNEKLYINLKENHLRFKLLKNPRTYKADLSSMVKREAHLASKAYFYEEDDTDEEEPQEELEEIPEPAAEPKSETAATDTTGTSKPLETSVKPSATTTTATATATATAAIDFLKNITPEQSEVRKIILSIVLGGGNFSLEKLDILEKFPKTTIDEVFYYMAKNKEIFLSTEDNKVHIGEKLSKALASPLEALDFPRIHVFQDLLKDLFAINKGLLLNPIFHDALMVPLIELMSSDALNLTRVDHYKNEIFEGYEARALDKTYLQSDIMVIPTEKSEALIQSRRARSIPIPNKGTACSYIWIDLQGEIIKEVWMKLVRQALIHVLFHPGVPKKVLFDLKFKAIVLEYKEFEVILQWMIDSGVVQVKEEDGLWVTEQYYQSI
ncbi:hypothetical protein WICPIJ_000474 [Wickerhamomyces pijperi]|uniref:Uncharacterized protein n=1 Tax=Wickerhamomyces pijperi TaxID=599730 RepID=A0A9P8QCR7_WICPI|nr:hypothetical protein WICPIJ_000474 [Wickerhamomyces pijperi]